MFVLVIGRIELIKITANQAPGIILKAYNGVKISAIITGVIITVSKNMFLTQLQCSSFSSDLSIPISFFISEILRSFG